MYFSDMCEKCTNQTAPEDYCHNCLSVAKKAFANWIKISVIMNVPCSHRRSRVEPRDSQA
ncbi:MAG: hypothetical protein P4M11_14905 [Candidatus Pacebacteria bacterium]|nr:hypothetical protein [Candidatus Paceibacterota bacterium]